MARHILWLGLACALTAAAAMITLRWAGWSVFPIELAVADIIVALVVGLPPFAAAAFVFPSGTRLGWTRVWAQTWVAVCVGLIAVAFVFEREPFPVPSWNHVAESGEPRGSVILIVLDTVRKDHMSLYGYERETTPHIDAWAAEGLTFDNMTSTSSWTIPSHGSMFTGHFARTHGARLLRMPSAPQGRLDLHLPGETITLAERARDAGYRTAAISAQFAGQDWGLAQGFEFWGAFAPKTTPRFPPSEWLASKLFPRTLHYDRYPILFSAKEVTGSAIRFLESRGKEPFFLYVNYMDVHTPNFLHDSALVPHDDELGFDDVSNVDAMQVLATPGRAAAMRRTLVNRYDRHMSFLDTQLGRLFEYFEAQGLLDDTLVVLTSDHGEYLGERGLAFHALDIHREVIHIPLVLRGPGVSRGRTDRPTQSTDIFALCLSGLGIDPPAGTFGRTLTDEPPMFLVSELYSQFHAALFRPPWNERFDRSVQSVRVGRYRYLEYSNGRSELYDVEADPNELEDLAAENTGVLEAGARELEGWRRQSPEARGLAHDVTELADDVVGRLRALGYVE